MLPDWQKTVDINPFSPYYGCTQYRLLNTQVSVRIVSRPKLSEVSFSWATLVDSNCTSVSQINVLSEISKVSLPEITLLEPRQHLAFPTNDFSVFPMSCYYWSSLTEDKLRKEMGDTWYIGDLERITDRLEELEIKVVGKPLPDFAYHFLIDCNRNDIFKKERIARILEVETFHR